MEERSPKYKIALDALSVVERYVSAINGEKCRDIYEFIKAEGKARELIEQNSFPSEVKRAVDRVTRAAAQKFISAIRLLDEETKRVTEVLEAEHKRKGEQSWRKVWKAVVLILYVLVMFGIYRKENWTLVFLCVPISFIEKLLLNDAFALRLWAWILAKKKNEER